MKHRDEQILYKIYDETILLTEMIKNYHFQDFNSDEKTKRAVAITKGSYKCHHAKQVKSPIPAG